MPDWLLPLILAPFVGSFAGVLIRRLPEDQPVVFDRSRCDHCSHVLAPWDLLPLVSFAALGGRCRYCGGRISFVHPAIELGCLIIAAWACMAETDVRLLWLDCALGWTLLTLAWIDWQHMLLPDVLTLPLVVAGLAATALLDPSDITEHAGAACAGYLTFRAIEIGYRRLRGRDGLGQGDAKLMAAAGAWVGLAALPAVVFTAALFGLITAAALGVAGRDMHRGSALPFGPALCAAIWVAWLGFDPVSILAAAFVDRLQ